MADTEQSEDSKALSRRIVDRMLSIYKADYIAHCDAVEPTSLLGLVCQLKRALELEDARG